MQSFMTSLFLLSAMTVPAIANQGEDEDSWEQYPPSPKSPSKDSGEFLFEFKVVSHQPGPVPSPNLDESFVILPDLDSPTLPRQMPIPPQELMKETWYAYPDFLQELDAPKGKSKSSSSLSPLTKQNVDTLFLSGGSGSSENPEPQPPSAPRRLFRFSSQDPCNFLKYLFTHHADSLPPPKKN